MEKTRSAENFVILDFVTVLMNGSQADNLALLSHYKLVSSCPMLATTVLFSIWRMCVLALFKIHVGTNRLTDHMEEIDVRV